MIPEIVKVVVIGLMVLVPIAFIYKKAGFNPAWSVLVFLPGFGLLIIFLQLAFVPWKNGADSGREI